MLTRESIAALIPHSGAMCLLHEVIRYDASGITCRAVNHRDFTHPLREAGALPAVVGVEYAAQAMAVHGALTGSVDVAPGVLAAIRDLVMHVDRLDDVADDLIVAAEKLWGEGTQLLYGFTISAGTRELLQGRATVMLTR